jgi:hypothetical protein
MGGSTSSHVCGRVARCIVIWSADSPLNVLPPLIAAATSVSLKRLRGTIQSFFDFLASQPILNLILTSSRSDLTRSRCVGVCLIRIPGLLSRASIAREGMFCTDLTLRIVLQFPSLHLDASLGDL